MKKSLIPLIIVIFLVSIISLFSQEFTYVGAGKCKICHKAEKRGKQYTIWEESKHSKAFLTLGTPEALPQAKEKGVENPTESPKCLKCHAPLYEKAAEFKEEGISCEVCHGPGSAYKKMSIMKSHEEAIKNGLTVYDSTEAIKKQCLKCHENPEKSFDFEASWEKIKHPLPEKD